MDDLKKILKIVFYAISFILAILCILSIFREAESRFIKMLDFPRIQFFMATILSLVIIALTFRKWKWYDYLLSIMLFLGLTINVVHLIHYTRLVPVEVPDANETLPSDNQLNILITNVQMSNRNSETLINLIEVKDPDIILAMEVDEWWSNELNVFKKDYPYSQHTINEVTYGMVLYSKLPMEKVEVDYLNNKKVPSFQSIIKLKNGKKITLHSIHPVPPLHFKDLPDNSGQKETAFRKLGNEIEDHQNPTIVVGDLNDAVWSRVDALTETDNILFDVRVGRGFYNSFNANHWYMRWPLDHVFVTKEFKLKNLERLEYVGSDHFPIFVELVF